jgi:hypothetical protein
MCTCLCECVIDCHGSRGVLTFGDVRCDVSHMWLTMRSDPFMEIHGSISIVEHGRSGAYVRVNHVSNDRVVSVNSSIRNTTREAE